MVKRSPYLPLFNEDFYNYGFNKVQWIEHLRYSGFEFYLASKTFAVDVPHHEFLLNIVIMIRSAFATSYKYEFIMRNVEMLRVYRSFLKGIRNNPDRSRQLLCDNNGMIILGCMIIFSYYNISISVLDCKLVIVY